MVLREQRLFRLSIIVVLVLMAFITQGTMADVTTYAKSPDVAAALDREHDPVVVKGLFEGAPPQEIYVYRFLAGVWEPIPFQVDLVDANGNYQSDLTGTLDANDEIVFMASDLGILATVPITTLNVQGPWYQVEVSDPQSPQDKGYAYVVRSATALDVSDVDYINFNAGTTRADSSDYAIGWADDQTGLDYLSMFGGANVLDRTKIRLTYRIGAGASQVITEEGNALIPITDVELIKDGPVRIIVNRGSALTLGYQSLLRTVIKIDLSTIPLLTIENVRSSTDLTSTVTGTYFDQNTVAGATIDGVADSVAETPFTQAWRQVSLSSGTMIQVTDLSGLGGFPRHYYKDDATVDAQDTGDGKSFGDSGFLIVNPSGKIFTFDSNLYFLSGAQQNRGSEYFSLYDNPIVVTATVQGEPAVEKAATFIPFAKK